MSSPSPEQDHFEDNVVPIRHDHAASVPVMYQETVHTEDAYRVDTAEAPIVNKADLSAEVDAYDVAAAEIYQDPQDMLRAMRPELTSHQGSLKDGVIQGEAVITALNNELATVLGSCEHDTITAQHVAAAGVGQSITECLEGVNAIKAATVSKVEALEADEAQALQELEASVQEVAMRALREIAVLKKNFTDSSLSRFEQTRSLVAAANSDIATLQDESAARIKELDAVEQQEVAEVKAREKLANETHGMLINAIQTSCTVVQDIAYAKYPQVIEQLDEWMARLSELQGRYIGALQDRTKLTEHSSQLGLELRDIRDVLERVTRDINDIVIQHQSSREQKLNIIRSEASLGAAEGDDGQVVDQARIAHAEATNDAWNIEHAVRQAEKHDPEHQASLARKKQLQTEETERRNYLATVYLDKIDTDRRLADRGKTIGRLERAAVAIVGQAGELASVDRAYFEIIGDSHMKRIAELYDLAILSLSGSISPEELHRRVARANDSHNQRMTRAKVDIAIEAPQQSAPQTQPTNSQREKLKLSIKVGDKLIPLEMHGTGM